MKRIDMSSFTPSLHPMDHTGPGVPPLNLNQNPRDPYESQIPPSQTNEDEPDPREPVPSVSEAGCLREGDRTPSTQKIPPQQSPPPLKRQREGVIQDGPLAKRVMGTVIIFDHFTPTNQVAPRFPSSPPHLPRKGEFPRSNVEKLEPQPARRPPDLYGFISPFNIAPKPI